MSDRILTHIMRTRVTEEELNVVANLAARGDMTAGQLVRKLIRDAASKVPNKERKRLAEPPTGGMRAIKLAQHEEKTKKRKGKRS